jgi:hypothetical protein
VVNPGVDRGRVEELVAPDLRNLAERAAGAEHLARHGVTQPVSSDPRDPDPLAGPDDGLRDALSCHRSDRRGQPQEHHARLDRLALQQIRGERLPNVDGRR